MMRRMSLDEGVGITESMFRGIYEYGAIRFRNLSQILLFLAERISSFSHVS
jgi:hypothetical protein